MFRSLRPLRLMGLSTLFVLIATPALARTTIMKLSASDRQAIERGKLVVRLRSSKTSNLKDVLIAGRIDAPLQVVWNIITDYPDYPKLWPRILKSETLDQHGLTLEHKTVLDYPWPLPHAWVISQVEQSPDERSVHWHRIAGSLKKFDGSWHLSPDGTGTLVIYSSLVDPGIPFIPPWIIDWANAQVAPDVIKAIRRHVKDLPASSSTLTS